MTYQLRNYQQQAVDAAVEHFRHSLAPAVIVLPTGAGKSLVIAELSRLARGRVLCLAHVKELVQQNHAKFCLTGLQAGIYSAGLKRKQRHEKVTFASIQSITNNLHSFTDAISLLIIDECHRVAIEADSQYQQAIQHWQRLNPNLKILGLTATPFRLGYGWIYQQHYYGFVRTEQPRFFYRCIYELSLRYMIKQGYLTPPILFNAAVAHYNFDQIDSTHTDQPAQLNSLIGKYPRVTQAIVEQIVQLSQTRQAVMIFACTIEHAQEVLHYLNAQQQVAAFIQGETPQRQRDDIILAFKARQIKYLVNVAVLTTGFDAPHVDVIAILRPTESISLFQQIVGRGLRLSPDKQDCLVLDYANNGYDLFAPEIGEKKPNSDATAVQVICPECNFANTFWGKLDAEGHLIEHYGRRCHGLIDHHTEGLSQCRYRFQFKNCPHCQAENDIAARACQDCHFQLVDADDILKKALSLHKAKVLRCAGIVATIEKAKVTIRYIDEDGSELTEHFYLNQKHSRDAFNQIFARRLAKGTCPINVNNTEELAPFLDYLPHPDFVIAQQHNHIWQVQERIFDYHGPYRKANQLS